MPDWSVMIGLIGGGQEIHVGEEEGLGQWLNALVASEKEWEVHCADQVVDIFKESNLILNINNKLNLDNELRFHMSKNLHLYIEKILLYLLPDNLYQSRINFLVFLFFFLQ